MIGSDVIVAAQSIFGDARKVTATDALGIIALNEGMREIARETLMLTGIISNTGNSYTSGLDLTATTDFILVKRITYDGVPLSLMDRETIDRMLLSQTPAGVPLAYHCEGYLLELFPVPVSGDTTVVKVYYAKLPTAIAAVGDTIGLPDVWKTDLINYVTMRFHEKNENWRAAENCLNKWNAGLSNRKFEGTTKDDSFRVIGPDYADWESDHGVINS